MAAESIHHEGRALSRLAWLSVAVLAFVEGCASHSERMLPIRSALDAGRPQEAIQLLDAEAGVADPGDLPPDMEGDNALFVLDRGTIQQSLARFDRSKRDLEAADKALDMLDLQHGAADTLGEYIFSGSSGKYRSAPYEKLLINTLDMMNYLELRDLNGARIEARRLAVMQRYVSDDLHEKDNSVLGLGAFLAGLTFEKSDSYDEALRWYDEALRFTGFRSLRDPVRSLLDRSQYRTPRLRELEGTSDVSVSGSSASGASGGAGPGSSAPSRSGAASGGAEPASSKSLDASGQGEIVFVVGYGRVPQKVAERVPIGLALTWASSALQPNDVSAANNLAAQGLVTWINYPTLGPEQGSFEIPSVRLDNQYVQLEEAVNVTREVRAEWKRIEAKIIVSAITRLIARYAAGSVVKAAAGKQELLGTLLSLGTQLTLTAMDTPDTRSWETLPARVAIARVRVPPGRHTLHLDARGVVRNTTVDVAKGDWAVVSLMALR